MFVEQEAWGDYWPWDSYQQEPAAASVTVSGQQELLIGSPIASCCTVTSRPASANDIDEDAGMCSSMAPHSSAHLILSCEQQQQPLVSSVVSSCNAVKLQPSGPALNTNGRPRAKRGSATDPQSVYARNRRDRINQRLKTLQHLVPNGAKVDIVTMLEEAIHYVKFLQLQVKLLSSDEFWMYAPTAYNEVEALAAFNS